MANEDFANSFNAIRVNMLTAFAPIWEVIKPALISFMQILARVTAMVAQFMATLFGSTVGAARDSAEALHNQAQGLRDVGGAAKDTRNELAGFDEINQQSADTGGGGAGAGGGGLDFDIAEPENIGWIDDLANRIRTFFTEIDTEYWHGLGERIAGRLADGLASIPWDNIQQGAYIGARNLAASINGFFASGEGRRLMEEAGNFAARALNTGLIAINTLFENVDFRSIGQNFGHGINRFVDRFNWSLLGRTIGNGINSAVDWVLGAVETINFAGIGSSIARSLNRAVSTINWGNIGRLIGDGIKGLLDMAINFVRDVDWGEIGKV